MLREHPEGDSVADAGSCGLRSAPHDSQPWPSTGCPSSGSGTIDFGAEIDDVRRVPLSVALRCRLPYAWSAMRDFLAARAIPGVEVVEEERYARTIMVAGQPGSIAVAPDADGLRIVVDGVADAELPGVVARLRRLFDCDADPAAIGAHLSADPHLAPLVTARPGLRVPGAWSGFELGVRAILGQQVSVAAATRLCGRLVAERGVRLATPAGRGLTHGFPGPERIAEVEIAAILGMPRARGAAIQALAAARLAVPDLFSHRQTFAAAVARLTAIRGIGPWTAQYVAMRVLRDPDAFPVGDLALMRALDTGGGRPNPAGLLLRAEAWRPFRAYAAMHLWMSDADKGRV